MSLSKMKIALKKPVRKVKAFLRKIRTPTPTTIAQASTECSCVCIAVSKNDIHVHACLFHPAAFSPGHSNSNQHDLSLIELVFQSESSGYPEMCSAEPANKHEGGEVLPIPSARISLEDIQSEQPLPESWPVPDTRACWELYTGKDSLFFALILDHSFFKQGCPSKKSILASCSSEGELTSSAEEGIMCNDSDKFQIDSSSSGIHSETTAEEQFQKQVPTVQSKTHPQFAKRKILQTASQGNSSQMQKKNPQSSKRKGSKKRKVRNHKKADGCRKKGTWTCPDQGGSSSNGGGSHTDGQQKDKGSTRSQGYYQSSSIGPTAQGAACGGSGGNKPPNKNREKLLPLDKGDWDDIKIPSYKKCMNKFLTDDGFHTGFELVTEEENSDSTRSGLSTNGPAESKNNGGTPNIAFSFLDTGQKAQEHSCDTVHTRFGSYRDRDMYQRPPESYSSQPPKSPIRYLSGSPVFGESSTCSKLDLSPQEQPMVSIPSSPDPLPLSDQVRVAQASSTVQVTATPSSQEPCANTCTPAAASSGMSSEHWAHRSLEENFKEDS